MAEPKQDPMHPLKHEQCYLCFTTWVEPPPRNAPSREEVRRAHKEYMARLEKVVSNDVVTDSARRIHLVRRLSCVSDLHFHR